MKAMRSDSYGFHPMDLEYPRLDLRCGLWGSSGCLNWVFVSQPPCMKSLAQSTLDDQLPCPIMPDQFSRCNCRSFRCTIGGTLKASVLCWGGDAGLDECK